MRIVVQQSISVLFRAFLCYMFQGLVSFSMLTCLLHALRPSLWLLSYPLRPFCPNPPLTAGLVPEEDVPDAAEPPKEKKKRKVKSSHAVAQNEPSSVATSHFLSMCI